MAADDLLGTLLEYLSLTNFTTGGSRAPLKLASACFIFFFISEGWIMGNCLKIFRTCTWFCHWQSAALHPAKQFSGCREVRNAAPS